MISDNIARIQDKIASVCERVGRNPNEITLVGVSKYADRQAIEVAIAAGITHIGENKVQQAQEKFNDIGLDVTRHMIGHLQTNKVKQALELFDLIESVDSIKLAREINKQAQSSIDVLVQVNTSGEEQKFGFSPGETLSAVKEIAECPQLNVQGLMTIAPHTDDEQAIRSCFQQLRSLFEKTKEELIPDLKYLSMGMTDDYEIAIEEGSNMVRIGRAIFQNE